MKMNFFEQVKGYSELYIFGAGKYAKTLVEYFMYTHNEGMISALVVSDIRNNPLLICGIPVIDIKSVNNDKSTSIIVIALQEKYHDEITTILMNFGFCNIINTQDAFIKEIEELNYQLISSYEDRDVLKRYIEPYTKTLVEICQKKGLTRDEIIRILIERIKVMKQRVHMSRLVVVLGTKCSLKCRECNNLIPHFKPQKDFDIDKIIMTLERLLELSDSILRCELVGGEPFLAKGLPKILDYVIEQSKIEIVEITTNGTMIPQQNLIEKLRNKKVVVRISDYGKYVNKDNIIKTCELHNINYQILETQKWISPGGIEKRNRDTLGLKEQYSKCTSGQLCKTLYEDKLFSCARSASLFNLGYMKEHEYIDMAKTITEEELIKFLTINYSIACDYCDISSKGQKFIEPAEQI